MKTNKILISASIMTGLWLATVAGMAAEVKTEATSTATKPYPLTKCIVSGDKLGGDMGKPYVFVQEGREIKLCCESCLGDFKKSTAAFLKKIDAAAAAAAKAHPYLLTKCLVSGEKLSGDMGKPFVFVYEDREIKLCCESCLKDFSKTPDKYMKTLAAADKARK